MLLNSDKTLKQDSNIETNKAKTKILVCSRQQTDTNITIGDIKLENVNSFTYLGRKITSDGESTTDLSCNVVRAKPVFFKEKNTLTTKMLKFKYQENIGKEL